MMAAETLPYDYGVVSNGDLAANSNSSTAAKNLGRAIAVADVGNRRRTSRPLRNPTLTLPKTVTIQRRIPIFIRVKVVEQVEIEYVPEKAELDEGLDEEFRKIFEKFSFTEVTGSEDNDKKDESAENATASKKADSDSEEEENDNEKKEKSGVSNKKKKLQRRMKIAELKQICSRSDVVEVWDATAADPKLLVFLKSYRNTVPVPRHWSQKRKFLHVSRQIYNYRLKKQECMMVVV
ncbi:hypothetical protein Lalb_Chr16g0383571 [Lupinus albus]|uniref:DUF382 domain-containing protein n=1 Tax=Lupinus albus TaxID=3870 RepID=A0A6A4P6I3_LUPAL|nr:hypothetical protein Lalb_Chr16g0383571 [Lupinus albus]